MKAAGNNGSSPAGRVILVGILSFPWTATALVPPHDATNNIGCGSCHVLHGSLGGALNPDSINNLCLSCHNGGVATEVSTHASGKDFTFSFDCSRCHDAHGSTNDVGSNIKLVRANIDTPTSGLRSVVFQTLGAGGDYARGAANGYNGVCEACHTVTTFHRNDASGDHSHNAAADCVTCHPHLDTPSGWGFRGAGQCMTCHNQNQGPRRIVAGASGDFVRNSHHANDGTTNEVVTNEHCTVCHAEGDNGSPNGTYHQNGQVELKDADGLGVYSVEDAVGESWAGSPSDDRDLSLFCLSCHDPDGASVTFISGGNALNPFNDLLTNAHEADQNGVAIVVQRPNVVDVRSQFDPNIGSAGGNPVSHHNVLAQRYINWQDGAGRQGIDDRTFTGVGLINGAVNEGGAGAGGLLECADCHTSGSNAHGASSRYFLLDANGNDVLWTENTLPCFRCHQESVYHDGANPNAAWSAVNHALNSAMGFHTDGDGSNKSRTIFRIMCLQCHGGRSFGSIHGNVEASITPENSPPKGAPATYTPYRFTNGASLDYLNDTQWQSLSNASCMTVAATNNINLECTQHRGQSFDRNYTRPLVY